MKKGCYTAIATPFRGDAVDFDGLRQLAAFQVESGVAGILAVGTTGESPTLSWNEHNQVIETVAGACKNKCLCIAGTGSNNTKEALEATGHAVAHGVDAVLLVDPYYNGPSSLEIRREYVAPVAEAFPDVTVIPYVVPGRTGAQLLPEDLGLVFKAHGNVNTVKEATGDLENMRKTRKCCGDSFTILSGDDGLTFEMMTDHEIQATGVISVVSNVAPKAVSDMVRLISEGEAAEAKKIRDALAPLFNLVVVKTMEPISMGEAMCRARNPLPLKTLMGLLGMPAGGCRQPLGKMTRRGLDVVLDAARAVQQKNPEIFEPVSAFFNVDVARRLEDPATCEGLAYEAY